MIAATVSNPHWQRHLEQIAPLSAGLAMQATTGLRGMPISPWAGLAVLAAWAAGAILAGGLLLRLRDALKAQARPETSATPRNRRAAGG